MAKREPILSPQQRLPAYESLDVVIRRIVRDELAPVIELLEELKERASARPA